MVYGSKVIAKQQCVQGKTLNKIMRSERQQRGSQQEKLPIYLFDSLRLFTYVCEASAMAVRLIHLHFETNFTSEQTSIYRAGFDSPTHISQVEHHVGSSREVVVVAPECLCYRAPHLLHGVLRSTLL